MPSGTSPSTGRPSNVIVPASARSARPKSPAMSIYRSPRGRPRRRTRRLREIEIDRPQRVNGFLRPRVSREDLLTAAQFGVAPRPCSLGRPQVLGQERGVDDLAPVGCPGACRRSACPRPCDPWPCSADRPCADHCISFEVLEHRARPAPDPCCRPWRRYPPPPRDARRCSRRPSRGRQ